MDKYLSYISNLTDLYGRCAEHTLAMQKDFPELTRVRGQFDCPINGKSCHWWLVTPDGEIVDPTVAQFPTKGYAAQYIPWEEGNEEPTGKCLQCGDLTYRFQCFCSDSCIKAAGVLYNTKSSRLPAGTIGRDVNGV